MCERDRDREMVEEGREKEREKERERERERLTPVCELCGDNSSQPTDCECATWQPVSFPTDCVSSNLWERGKERERE